MILEYDFDGNDFEYEVESQQLKDAIINIVLTRNNIRKINSGEYNLLAILLNELDVEWNNTILDNFEDELHDYFYEDAYIRYQEQQADSADAETWFGTKNDIVGV